MKRIYSIVDIRSENEEQEDDEDVEESQKEGFSGIGERLLKRRTILLSGEVEKSLAARIVGQLLYLESENDEPIKMFIDTPGGDVNAAFAIFDIIRFIKPTVTIVGMGLIASAGALILLAAQKKQRLGLKNSHYMIHQPLSGMSGVAADIEIHAREVERIRDKINNIIATECGKSIAQVEKDTDRDFWLSAEEGKQYGLISKIITASKNL